MVGCTLSCAFSVLWLFFHILLATIIHDVSKVQKHVHDKSLCRCVLAVQSHVAVWTEGGVGGTPGHCLESIRLSKFISTIYFEQQIQNQGKWKDNSCVDFQINH